MPGGQKDAETRVYFWNGSKFDEVRLPELPELVVNARGAKQLRGYDAKVRPVRWLASGELEVEQEDTLVSRQDGASYTGSRHVTIAFDGDHRATVKHASKVKTEKY